MPASDQYSQDPSDILSSEEEDALEYARYRRRHSRKLHGRLWVLAIFVIYSAKGLYAYLNFPTERMLGAEINSEIWTIVLVIAMLKRRSWARYVFCVYVVFSAVVYMILIPELMKFMPGSSRVVPMVVCCVVDAAVAAALICIPSIRRLASRNYA